MALADDNTVLLLRAQTESVDTAAGWSGRHFALGELRWQRGIPGDLFGGNECGTEGSTQHGMLRGVFTARQDSRDGGALRVNELSLERPLAGGFATVGKKVMGWDVGYAFRPLDVVQQEDRRALNPVTQEGVPMLAWEAFDASRAITVVWTNPGHGKGDQPKGDGALAVRLYRQAGATDQYAVLRASRRNGLEGGVSFSHVAGDELEWHGSVLLQQRHDEWVLRRTAPPQWQRFDGGGKALAGFTWTTESKFSVLGEAWLDRTAGKGRQRNLLLRASQTAGDAEVAADVLWQPRQGAIAGSRVASVSATWKASPWLLSASLRHFSGAAAAFTRTVAVASVQYAF